MQDPIAEPKLPDGTVTFLFTDIEGSTDLAQKFPDALPALLERHHAILQTAIETQRGIVFRIAGDAFSAAFHTASDALAAAIAAQRALTAEAWDPAPIRVRMGINTGTANVKGLDRLGSAYEGYSTLARVARVMALAHGGQILLANSTGELVRDTLRPDISLRDMGEHKLKGFLSTERLWQVVAPALPQNFPPLQTPDEVPGNLPATPGPLVGRVHELEQVKQRLAQTRLLTLLGPGGAGKTRLALQAASDLRDEFQDHVYFVDLAASRDADAVVAAIGRTLGVREASDRQLLDQVKGQIQNKKMLSLLDNFEQVTVAAPAMAELLRDCPALKMLVTSREALHVRGENVFPVPPLSLPRQASKPLSLEQIARCEAVQLFVERAQAVKPDFQLTRANAPAIAEICVRLDGLPLAIELATARLNVFTPQALAERLSRHLDGSSHRLQLLRGGARDLPVRQQTLRDTIAWSFDLLDAGEQQMFALLSVFSGATFEAVEAVSGQIRRLDNVDVFEVVGSLADKSLLRQSEARDGVARFQMLETIREFAAARLDREAEFRADTQRAHARYFADFTQREWENLTGEGRDAALQRLTADLDNLRTAWRYWAAEGNLEQLGKFTDSLWFLYDARGWYHASIELISELLKILATTVSTPERLRQEILLQTGLARAIQSTKGYTEEVALAYRRALELCDRAGEIPELFPVLRGLSSFYVLRAEHAQAHALAQRIVRLAEQLGDAGMRTEGQMVIGYTRAWSNLPEGLEALDQAIARYDPQRQRARRLGLGTNAGVVALNASAMFSWMAGFPERARRRANEGVLLARKLDHPFSVCYALFHHGLLHLWLGQPQVTLERTRVLLDLATEHEFQIWNAVGACIRGVALVRLGSAAEGIPMSEDGMKVYRDLKTPPVFWPLLLYFQAGAYGLAARPREGLTRIDDAIALGGRDSGATLAPELLGLRGELLGALGQTAQAEIILEQAVRLAQAVKAPMLELRAALKLGRLWQAQGKTEPAKKVLGDAYAQMTEGFNFADLVQAQTLLQELAV